MEFVAHRELSEAEKDELRQRMTRSIRAAILWLCSILLWPLLALLMSFIIHAFFGRTRFSEPLMITPIILSILVVPAWALLRARDHFRYRNIFSRTRQVGTVRRFEGKPTYWDDEENIEMPLVFDKKLWSLLSEPQSSLEFFPQDDYLYRAGEVVLKEPIKLSPAILTEQVSDSFNDDD